MSAIYFMGLVPEFEDDEWDHETAVCRCDAAPAVGPADHVAIRITTRKGGNPTAECPACHQEYTVMVEGKGREGCYPMHPSQIL